MFSEAMLSTSASEQSTLNLSASGLPVQVHTSGQGWPFTTAVNSAVNITDQTIILFIFHPASNGGSHTHEGDN